MFIKNNFSLIKYKKLSANNLNNFRFKNNFCKTTSDLNEIRKFDKFSKEFNWFTSEQLKPLRNLNYLRIPLIKNQLCNYNKNLNVDTEYPLKGIKLLDVGCGGGLLSEPLANLGANITAIDANLNNIEFAKNYLNLYSSNLKNKLNYINSNLETFAKNKTDYFDALLASEVLEHVDNIELFVKCAHSVLKKNGLFFITTINQSWQSYLFVILLAENLFKLIPKGTHSYNKLVLINGLCLILKENNFSIQLVHGMRFNPITKNWFWTSDTSMNYALVARKI